MIYNLLKRIQNLLASKPSAQRSLHKAVFFNRDGTIIYNGKQHYIYRTEDVVLNERVAQYYLAIRQQSGANELPRS